MQIDRYMWGAVKVIWTWGCHPTALYWCLSFSRRLRLRECGDFILLGKRINIFFDKTIIKCPCRGKHWTSVSRQVNPMLNADIINQTLCVQWTQTSTPELNGFPDPTSVVVESLLRHRGYRWAHLGVSTHRLHPTLEAPEGHRHPESP